MHDCRHVYSDWPGWLVSSLSYEARLIRMKIPSGGDIETAPD